MLKIGAVLNLILAGVDGALSWKWFSRSREDGWERKSLLLAALWLVNAVIQVLLACKLWNAAAARSVSGDGDEWDDFEDFED